MVEFTSEKAIRDGLRYPVGWIAYFDVLKQQADHNHFYFGNRKQMKISNMTIT